MDKLIAVLAYIDTGSKTWNEIDAYCDSIGFERAYNRKLLNDYSLLMEIESGKYRLNMNGMKLLEEYKKSGNPIEFQEGKLLIRNSNGVIAFIGNNNTLSSNAAQSAIPTPIKMQPYEGNELFLVHLGRKLIGKRKHGMAAWSSGTLVATFLEFFPILGLPYLINGSSLGKFEWIDVIFIAVLSLLVGVSSAFLLEVDAQLVRVDLFGS